MCSIIAPFFSFQTTDALLDKINLDTLGIESSVSHVLCGCDSTTSSVSWLRPDVTLLTTARERERRRWWETYPINEWRSNITFRNTLTSRRSWCIDIIKASHTCVPEATPGGRMLHANIHFFDIFLHLASVQVNPFNISRGTSQFVFHSVTHSFFRTWPYTNVFLSQTWRNHVEWQDYRRFLKSFRISSAALLTNGFLSFLSPFLFFLPSWHLFKILILQGVSVWTLFRISTLGRCQEQNA